MTILASQVQVQIAGEDVTTRTLFSESSFMAQANAVPGDFTVMIKDLDHSFEVVSGSEMTLHIDGFPYFGGFVKRIGRNHFFPVEDSTVPEDVARKWRLRGPDFNILFDKLVLRDTDNYLRPLRTLSDEVPINRAVKHLLNNFIDIPPGLGFDEHVTASAVGYGPGLYVGQGKYLRDQMEDFAQYGAFYYIDADKELHFETAAQRRSSWAFVDHNPNGVNRIGFREATYDEDAMQLVTDSLVWGGSSLHKPGADPDTPIGTVFARYPDPPAANAEWQGFLQTAEKEQQAIDRLERYGRWQRAEFKVGQSGFLTMGSVKNRAYTTVAGFPGIDPATGVDGGLNIPQPSIQLTWFGHDVPRDEFDTPLHIVPGDLVDIILYTMGRDRAHPLVLTLPLRQVRISFPTLPSDNPDHDPKGYVRFDGDFGLSSSDPRFLWRYLLTHRRGSGSSSSAQLAATVDNESTTATRGARGTLVPAETPNGIRKVFTLPFGYLAGTTEVYLNGLLQRPTLEYVETDPGAGEIRFLEAPAGPSSGDPGDSIFVICQVNQA